jgi:hypothetical protein
MLAEIDAAIAGPDPARAEKARFARKAYDIIEKAQQKWETEEDE